MTPGKDVIIALKCLKAVDGYEWPAHREKATECAVRAMKALYTGEACWAVCEQLLSGTLTDEAQHETMLVALTKVVGDLDARLKE